MKDVLIADQKENQESADVEAKKTQESSDDGESFYYYYNTGNVKTGITSLLSDMNKIGINLFDIQTEETSLEEIFVKIIKD